MEEYHGPCWLVLHISSHLPICVVCACVFSVLRLFSDPSMPCQVTSHSLRGRGIQFIAHRNQTTATHRHSYNPSLLRTNIAVSSSLARLSESTAIAAKETEGDGALDRARSANRFAGGVEAACWVDNSASLFRFLKASWNVTTGEERVSIDSTSFSLSPGDSVKVREGAVGVIGIRNAGTCDP